MKLLARNSEDPVVVPIVLDQVKIEVPVAIRAVEIRHTLAPVRVLADRAAVRNPPPKPPPLEYSRGCIVFEIVNPLVGCAEFLHFYDNIAKITRYSGVQSPEACLSA